MRILSKTRTCRNCGCLSFADSKSCPKCGRLLFPNSNNNDFYNYPNELKLNNNPNNTNKYLKDTIIINNFYINVIP